MNAPRSCPNSSLSISVSRIAAQLMATNGLLRRFESSWIVRATSSLPVPLSPWISTVHGPAAICRTRWRNCIIAVLEPTSS